MKNAECTPISPEEEKELFAAFPKYLSGGEEALAREFFPRYVFFKTVGKDVRRCVCTSCMEGFHVSKSIRPDFFKIKHKGACECPNCGQRAALLAMGKYQNFDGLRSHERAVRINTYKGWLLLQAGYVSRWFGHEDLGGYIGFEPFRMYAFAPGRRAGWETKTYSWFGEAWRTDGLWKRMGRIKSPFQSRAYEMEASYWPMGVENIAKSSLRYCQYDAWFDMEYGSLIGGLEWAEEPFRIAHLIRYLAEYTRRPQMEFLVKLGFHQVVSDLVLQGKAHKDILNWSAQNPADFFRLSKADFRLFRESEYNFEELKGFPALRRQGRVKDFAEFVWLSKSWGCGFSLVRNGATLAHISLTRAARYLRSLDMNPAVAAQLWADYLDAAGKLKYDLSRDDVRMPNNLVDRHDLAVAAAQAEEDEKVRKRYAARYRRLVERFEFSLDGLSVVVPKGIQDIVREGKILRHCVGGYAERHVSGTVTILFLRKGSAPGVPYVTIELSAENNCRELSIRQIHGYRNELDGGLHPSLVHKGFLDAWLAWVHAGSPRDADGLPVAVKKASIA